MKSILIILLQNFSIYIFGYVIYVIMYYYIWCYHLILFIYFAVINTSQIYNIGNFIENNFDFNLFIYVYEHYIV